MGSGKTRAVEDQSVPSLIEKEQAWRREGRLDALLCSCNARLRRPSLDTRSGSPLARSQGEGWKSGARSARAGGSGISYYLLVLCELTQSSTASSPVFAILVRPTRMSGTTDMVRRSDWDMNQGGVAHTKRIAMTNERWSKRSKQKSQDLRLHHRIPFSPKLYPSMTTAAATAGLRGRNSACKIGSIVAMDSSHALTSSRRFFRTPSIQ